MYLGDRGYTRRALRQGGGRGTGADHVDEILGCTEFYIYQPPNSRVKGFPSLKVFLEAQECEVIFTADAPPELAKYETVRITYKKAGIIPDHVSKRGHAWAHRNNFLHSFFKPMYQ